MATVISICSGKSNEHIKADKTKSEFLFKSVVMRKDNIRAVIILPFSGIELKNSKLSSEDKDFVNVECPNSLVGSVLDY